MTTIITPTSSLTRLSSKVFDPLWLRPVLDDVGTGFLLEVDERIVYINRCYSGYLGCKPDDVLFRHVSAVVAPIDAPRLLSFSRQRAAGGAAPRDYDFLAGIPGSTPIRLHASVTSTAVQKRVLIAAVAMPATQPEAVSEDAPFQARAQPDGGRRLSARELEIMERILSGQRVKEIALTLEISSKTVATHRTRLLRKLGLNNNRDLFEYAVRHKLIDWS